MMIYIYTLHIRTLRLSIKMTLLRLCGAHMYDMYICINLIYIRPLGLFANMNLLCVCCISMICVCDKIQKV